MEQSLLEAKRSPQRADLSSLMALSDWFNDRAPNEGLQARYIRPETPEARQKRLMELEGAIQEKKSGLTKNQISLMKEQLEAYQKAQINPLTNELKQAQIDFYRTAAGDKGGAAARSDRAFNQNLREDFGKSEDAKKIRAAAELRAALNNYKQKLAKYGTQYTGEAAADLDSAFNLMGLAYKENKKLGALTGPDWEIVKGSVAPATGWAGATQDALRGGRAGIAKGIKNMEDDISTGTDIAESSASTLYGNALVGEYRKNVEAGALKNLALKAKMQRMKELENKARE